MQAFHDPVPLRRKEILLLFEVTRHAGLVEVDGYTFTSEVPTHVSLEYGSGSDSLHDIEVVSLLETAPDPSLNPYDLVNEVLKGAPYLERPNVVLDLRSGHVLLQINDSSVVMEVKLLYSIL